MSVVAKFKVAYVKSYETSAEVVLNPVYAGEGADPKVTTAEDGAFWQATPSGELKMTVNNIAAAEEFQPGNIYYLTFDRADG